MAETQSVFERRLASFFQERLEELTEDEAYPHEDTLWCMGNLLARFGDSRQLFSYEDGNVDLRPLALLYKDACETTVERERCVILRHLGDLALFLGALFPENYSRRGIRLDYFVGMGGGAYEYLSEHASHSRHVFSELSASFTSNLELVAEACTRTTCFDSSDILALYERWKKTGNPVLARQLQALGIEGVESTQVH